MDDVIGQDRVLHALAEARRRGRLPHALLFLGPQGVGRELVAKRLGRGLLCEAANASGVPFGCGRCLPCRKVDGGTHPDFHVVLAELEGVRRGTFSPDGSRRPSRDIRVDQVRALSRELRMRPYEGRARVAVIVDAHRMNANAANALLKTLEEPPRDAFLILLAPHARALLPTIASRCMRLAFAPLADESVIAILEKHGIDEPRARGALAEGSVATAATLDLEALRERRQAAAELITTLAAASAGERLDLVERLGRDREDVQELLLECQAVLGQTLRRRVFDERGDEDFGTVPDHRLLELFDGIEETRAALNANAHVQIALEELALLRVL